MTTDQHTLRFELTNKKLSCDDVETKINDFLSRASHKYNISREYIYNPRHNKQGEFVGYGYVWFQESTIYYLLQGLAADGRKLVKELPLSQKAIKNLNALELRDGESWADFMDREDAVRDRHKPKNSKKKLSPPVDLPHGLTFYPMTVTDWDGYSSYSLFCSNAPRRLRIGKVKEAFNKFSTVEGYPKVERKDKGDKVLLFVKFHPQTHDALFAILLCMKITVEGKQLAFTCARDS